MKRRFPVVLAALALLVTWLAASAPPEQAGTFSFAVAGDARTLAGPDYHESRYFLGALDAIRAAGEAAFPVIHRRCRPAALRGRGRHQHSGPGFPLYPAVANHDTGKAAHMAYIRGLNPGGTKLPNPVRKGPRGSEETLYAFDWSDARIVVLDEYYDGSSDTGANGDITDATFAWLNEALSTNMKPFIFVVGHDPAYIFPYMDLGRVQHEGGGLEVNPGHRDRFWQLLRDRHVTAYICAHTHNASAKKIDGLCQLDSAQAPGKGDTGAPSTFIKITVGEADCRYE